jgi:hypothetical protein
MTHPFSVKIVDMGGQTPLLEPSKSRSTCCGALLFESSKPVSYTTSVPPKGKTLHVVPAPERTQGRVSYYWSVKFALLLLLHSPLEQTLGPGDADVNVARLITEV